MFWYFFAEKMCKSYSHFFSKKFQHICVSLDVNFNESLTNDFISFEQLGLEQEFIQSIFLPLSQKIMTLFWQHLKHFDYNVGIIRNELLLLWIWLMCKFQQIAIKSTKIKCFPIIISKVILPLWLIKEGQLSVTGKSVCTKYWSGAYRT